MDGIVYSDRTPQVDYWQVRKVYSPVQITTSERTVEHKSDEIIAVVENRFDFRSLAGYKLERTVMSNGADHEFRSRSPASGQRTPNRKPSPFRAGHRRPRGGLSSWIELRAAR